MSEKWELLREASLSNHCPECFNQDLSLRFKQKHKHGRLFHRITGEVQEELRTTPTGLEMWGENSFQFVDGYSTHVYVFRADGCDPEPEETDEAAPIWAPVERIPYDQMWEDDDLWLPLVLRRRRFTGRFIFDGDRMLDYQVEEQP